MNPEFAARLKAQGLKPSTGCWIDGHWGIYGMTRLIEIAQEYGFVIDDNDEAAVLAYRNAYEVFEGDTGEDYSATDWVVDLADDAEAWLQANVAEDGYSFGWSDGEFFYMADSWWEDEWGM